MKLEKKFKNKKMHNETNIMDSYVQVHGWLSCFICLMGVAFNLLNLIILKKCKIEAMFKTNFILMSIASCDSILMISYFFFSFYTYILKSKNDRELAGENDEFWSLLSIVHMILSLTFHAMSIWLTVYLALFRYIFISESVNSLKPDSKSIKSKKPSFIIKYYHLNVMLIFFFCLLISLPVYSYPIFKYSLKINETFIGMNKPEVDQLVFNSIFYTQGFLVKIIPCCLLVTFISLLIKQLITINKSQKKFKSVSIF